MESLPIPTHCIAVDPEFYYRLEIMKRFASLEKLQLWTMHVSASDLSYHKIRKELWKQFIALITSQPVAAGESVEISSTDFVVVKQFLTAKNDKVTDDVSLSFTETLESLIEKIPDLEEDSKSNSSDSINDST